MLPQQRKNIMAIINFGGTEERVVTRKEFPMAKARKVLKNEVIAIIGYGVQGPAQGLNLRDNGFNVIVGQAKSFQRDWDRAVKDGWVPGKTLFDIEEAVQKATIIQMLVSDAAQRAIWPMVKKNLKPGDALYFSHGFSIAYKKQTGVIPPEDVDVIMVAPKGSGLNVRRNFLTGAGINSSFAVEQDATGRAEDRCIAIGIGVGSGYLFPTTFQHEVFSDLTGERGVLMGALAGIMEAQYDVLRAHGHTPSEAFNETVEELTQVSSASWTKTAWTGCIPTARPPPSAARSTGNPSSRKPRCRCSRTSTTASRPAKNAPACFPPAARRIIRRSCRRSWRRFTIRKCGRLARLPARCGPSNRKRPLPKAPKASPDARQINLAAVFISRK